MKNLKFYFLAIAAKTLFAMDFDENKLTAELIEPSEDINEITFEVFIKKCNLRDYFNKHNEIFENNGFITIEKFKTCDKSELNLLLNNLNLRFSHQEFIVYNKLVLQYNDLFKFINNIKYGYFFEKFLDADFTSLESLQNISEKDLKKLDMTPLQVTTFIEAVNKLKTTAF